MGGEKFPPVLRKKHFHKENEHEKQAYPELDIQKTAFIQKRDVVERIVRDADHQKERHDQNQYVKAVQYRLSGIGYPRKSDHDENAL